jgi:cation diffusion facilitator family transporter
VAHQADSKKVVVAALLANGGIAITKLVTAYFSGSVTMLAEGVHSIADTANQALLLLGMTLALRSDPLRYPLGRQRERYFWAFIVAITLFLLGGVFAIFEGVHKLRSPETEHTGSLVAPLVVLVVSLCLEIGSFVVAIREFERSRAGRPVFSALFGGKDPTIPVVLLEDAGAVLGLVIAIVALAVTWATGSALPDGIGSIVIGVLLCGIGFLLAYDTHGLLIGEGATPEQERRVIEISQSSPNVSAVTQLLTLQLGPDAILLALKVRFRDGLALADVEAAVDVLERRIREEVPQMKRIFVEPDSRYDAALDAERRAASIPR